VATVWTIFVYSTGSGARPAPCRKGNISFARMQIALNLKLHIHTSTYCRGQNALSFVSTVPIHLYDLMLGHTDNCTFTFSLIHINSTELCVHSVWGYKVGTDRFGEKINS